MRHSTKIRNVSELLINKIIDKTIEDSMIIYTNKLSCESLEVGLEAAFQFNLGVILKDILELNRFYEDEKIKVLFERNMPIILNKNITNNYIDIVIEYSKNKIIEQYLLELKFKKHLILPLI